MFGVGDNNQGLNHQHLIQIPKQGLEPLDHIQFKILCKTQEELLSV